MSKRYPAASWSPLGPQTQERMRSHDIVCIHTMVGSLAGTDTMFHRDGYHGTESHFGTGGDGACEQWQDLAFTADANLDGKYRVISIENADTGSPFPAWGGSNVPRFSAPQADRLVDLIAWLCSKQAHADCPSSWRCHQEGIPARLVQDSKPGRRGIATHRQGIDGNFPGGILAGRVAGGEHWSTSRGKACPGDRRIEQLVDEIIPAVNARLNQQEDEMTPEDWTKLEGLVRDVVRAELNPDDVVVPTNEAASYIDSAGKGGTVLRTSAVTRIWRRVTDIEATLVQIREALTASGK